MNKKLTFEQATERLEAIVNEMENGKVTLDRSLELFEEGVSLVKQCNTMLDNAEQKVSMLVKTDSGYEITDFNGENNG